MEQGTAAGAFAAMLRDLYGRAGSPTLMTLVRQGRRQQPSVGLNTSSLSDWLAGRSVPGQQRVVQFLVTYLAQQAALAGRAGAPPGWPRLWEGAVAERRQRRGGRPARPGPGSGPALEAPVRGRFVAELRPEEAFSEWEVHRPVDVPTAVPGSLPLYVRRAHDEILRSVLEQAAAGTSRMVVLVGESSSGKTRACWEAVAELPAGWRLWHPLDPSPARALANALHEGIAPRTAIWLNELQRYVGEQAGAGTEQVAAGLRRLLQDGTNGPVLVLGTVWPEFWNALTAPPVSARPDPNAQVRALLEGKAVHVPAAFEVQELEDARTVGGHDSRLADALAHTTDGRLTQYLAGAPALLERYRTAPPAVRAVISAAMDASRLGGVTLLAREFLETAAEGYLSDDAYDALGEGWLRDALAYTQQPSKGVRGLLSRVRARPGASGPGGLRLSDYMDHIGRTERRFSAPPASFWRAAHSHLSEAHLVRALGRAAESRWRDAEAAGLYQRALDLGDAKAGQDLAWLWQERQRDDEARRAEEQTALAGDGDALEELLMPLLEQGEFQQADQLVREAADRGNPTAQLHLARALVVEGETREAAHWYAEVARCSDPDVLRAYGDDLREQGDLDGARAAWRAAGDRRAMGELAALVAESGSADEAEQAAREAFAAGEATPLKDLAEQAEVDGRSADAARLYRDAITVFERRRLQRDAGVDLIDFEAGPRSLLDHLDPAVLPMPPGETWALRQLVALLDGTQGALEGDGALAQVAGTGNPWALERLLRRMRERGQVQEAEALLCSEASRANPWALWVQAHRAVHDAQVPDDARRVLLQRAAAARVGQAVRVLMDQAEQAGQAGEADQWALHASARGYTTPLWELVQGREQHGRLDAAEQLAWQAPARQRSWTLRRLAQRRSGEQAMPLLRRAFAEALAWAPGLLAERLEASRDFVEAERFARLAADAGDRQALEELAARRSTDDPDRQWQTMLANGLTAEGITAAPW
ncbi:AAA family ATPase [Streptomyces sp. Tue6028]|uniref:AAA family ATPase n=1 Tax=Streptomyces sp. Tue6028 TaxID=2036037 RepID=UPI003D70FDCA